MAYARVNFADNVTPLNAANMNTLDAYIATLDSGKIDKDSVVVAATRIVASKLLAADAQNAFQILGDGKHSWGPGGATAPDTTLARTGVGMLTVTDDITARNFTTTTGALVARGRALTTSAAIVANVTGDTIDRIKLAVDGTLSWGPGNAAADVTLSRVNGTELTIGGRLVVGSDYGTAGDTGLYLQCNGPGGRKVVVGAVDSGGTGFRMLRIGN